MFSNSHRLAVFIFFAIALIVGTATQAEASGRWKSDGAGGCYFDANDDGPDQCTPTPGRWKFDGQRCYWETTDSGPNQCDPTSEEPPPGAEVPQVDENATPDVDYGDDGFGVETAGPTFLPLCTSYTKRGATGYIAIQTAPDGTIAWGAYMYVPLWNFGPWWANVMVNASQVDYKFQYYPPHGSVNASQAPSGGVLVINVVHVFPIVRWSLIWSSEFGYHYAMSYGIARSTGRAACKIR